MKKENILKVCKKSFNSSIVWWGVIKHENVCNKQSFRFPFIAILSPWGHTQIMFNLPSDMVVPVLFLSYKYWLPNDPRLFHQQMLVTLNSLLKVIKKVAQRNFLFKLKKMNLVTQHAAYVRRLILSETKREVNQGRTILTRLAILLWR